MPSAQRRFAAWFAAAAIAITGAGASTPAAAVLIPVTSAAQLQPTLTVDWSVFGPAGTFVSVPDQRTVNGLDVFINVGVGTAYRHDEGVDYTGIFTPGDALIGYDGCCTEFLRAVFTPPVAAVGTQIQANPPGPFVASMNVFGIIDGGRLQPLGRVSVAGNNTRAQDGSAPFIGAVSTEADIGVIIFDTTTDNPFFPISGDIAINRLLVREAPAAAVSEPASALLVVPALLGLLASRRIGGQCSG